MECLEDEEIMHDFQSFLQGCPRFPELSSRMGATHTTLELLFAPIFDQRIKIMDGQVVKLGNKLSLLFWLFTSSFLPLENPLSAQLKSVLCNHCRVAPCSC